MLIHDENEMLQMHNKVHTNSVKYTKQIVNLIDSDYSNLKMIQDMKQNWSKHAPQSTTTSCYFFPKTKTYSIEYILYIVEEMKKHEKKMDFCVQNTRDRFAFNNSHSLIIGLYS